MNSSLQLIQKVQAPEVVVALSQDNRFPLPIHSDNPRARADGARISGQRARYLDPRFPRCVTVQKVVIESPSSAINALQFYRTRAPFRLFRKSRFI
jgi:hypothetical protein